MSIFRRNRGSEEGNAQPEQALLWAAVAESCHDAILVVDESGTIEFANPAAERLFRCSVGELVGESVLRFLPPPGGSAATRKSRRLTATAKDGRMIPVEIELRDVQAPSRHLITLAVRSILEPVDEETEVLKQVVGAAPALLLVTDRDGRILLFNHACEEFTEFAAAEVRGKGVGEALAATDEGTEVDAVWREVLSGKRAQTECEWLTRTGQRRKVVCRHAILRDDLGLASHVVTVASEARKSAVPDRALVNDFSNLLTSISGYAELALESLRETDPLRKDIEEIKKAGDRAAEIVAAAMRATAADR